MGLKMLSFPAGPLSVNTYLVWDEDTKISAVIDPADAGLVECAVKEKSLVLKGILLTHGHFDHILGVAELQKKYQALVMVHALDEKMLHDPLRNLGGVFGCEVESCHADHYLQDEENIAMNGISLQVIHTPGHSMGSCCFLQKENGWLFTGDTLFCESYGRTDFPGGSIRDLERSINDKLFCIEGEYDVLPGHGETSTLSYERNHNPMGIRG